MTTWKVGMTFDHDRFIIGSPRSDAGARPDVCRITRVTKWSVYYRNESGMLFSMDPEHFRKRFGHRICIPQPPEGVTS